MKGTHLSFCFLSFFLSFFLGIYCLFCSFVSLFWSTTYHLSIPSCFVLFCLPSFVRVANRPHAIIKSALVASYDKQKQKGNERNNTRNWNWNLNHHWWYVRLLWSLLFFSHYYFWFGVCGRVVFTSTQTLSPIRTYTLHTPGLLFFFLRLLRLSQVVLSAGLDRVDVPFNVYRMFGRNFKYRDTNKTPKTTTTTTPAPHTTPARLPSSSYWY